MLTGKYSASREMSASHEHYLRAIWEVRAQRGYARLTDVARELAIALPTLSVAIKGLEARELVRHDDQRFLVLTERGERVAREVHHRFEVMRRFLEDVLGLDAPSALRDACLLEHDVSAATTERLLDMLKLLRDDLEFREVFRRRLAEHRRTCRPAAECSTCDLACFEAPRT